MRSHTYGRKRFANRSPFDFDAVRGRFADRYHILRLSGGSRTGSSQRRTGSRFAGHSKGPAYEPHQVSRTVTQCGRGRELATGRGRPITSKRPRYACARSLMPVGIVIPVEIPTDRSGPARAAHPQHTERPDER